MNSDGISHDPRRGDDGTTSLAGGTRVEKNSPYMQAIGVVDELNSLIGMAIASECGSDLRVVLSETQDELVALSSELRRRAASS